MPRTSGQADLHTPLSPHSPIKPATPLLHLALLLLLALSCIAALVVVTLSYVVVDATVSPPSNCLPTAPFNVSLDPTFRLRFPINFSPFSCSLLLLGPLSTVLAFSSITGQPLYSWQFPVDYNSTLSSDRFSLSATNDRLYTITFFTDPHNAEACTNVVALSTAAGKVAWTRSICAAAAVGAKPYAGGGYVVVGNMTRAAGGGMVDYVVHFSSSTSLNRTTRQPVNENYSMAVYESESGAVLSAVSMGVMAPQQLSLLSVRDDGSALLLLVVGSGAQLQSSLLYSLDGSGQLSFIRNISASVDSDWKQRYQSSTMVYSTPFDCFIRCTYIGVHAWSGEQLWQVRDSRLDGYSWFNSTALPDYLDDKSAAWWPKQRDSSPPFLSSNLLWVANQALNVRHGNRTLVVAQHAVYDLRTGNYTALSDLVGPVESYNLYPTVGIQRTRDGQPVLELNRIYFVLDAVTLAVVERGVLPSGLAEFKYVALQEWRGVNDSWVWCVGLELGPNQWVAATQIDRGAALELAAPTAVFER